MISTSAIRCRNHINMVDIQFVLTLLIFFIVNVQHKRGLIMNQTDLLRDRAHKLIDILSEEALSSVVNILSMKNNSNDYQPITFREKPYDSYTNYYVAFLDILGFKNIVDNESCSYIWDIFDRHADDVHLAIFNTLTGESTFEERNIHLKIFSDSIIMYISADCKNALQTLALACVNMQSELLSRNRFVLLRGGVTYGKFFAGETVEDGDIIFGPALVDAYKLEEEKAKDPRILVSDIALYMWNRDNNQRNYIDEMNTLIRKDTDGLSYLDYIGFYLKHYGTRDDARKKLTFIENELQKNLSCSVRSKYLYLKNKILEYVEPSEG